MEYSHISNFEWGLNIKDLLFMSLSLRAKILQCLVSIQKEWWKIVFHKKYFGRNQLICLDYPLRQQKGLHIWKLCKVASEIIPTIIFWILRNGKQIKWWVDRILNNPPISNTHSLGTLLTRCFIRALKLYMIY